MENDNVLQAALKKTGDSYELIKRLGGGEFSNVYHVRNKKTREEKALKVLDYHYLLQKLKKENPAESINKFNDIKRRFITETKLYEKIDQPNIVKIHDTGVVRAEDVDIEVPYFVMDYIKGLSLSDVIRNEAPMDVDKVMKMAHNVLDALTVIHKNHIIHRDLKPANIMIRQGSGEAVLIDFGIAKNILGSTKLTTTGTLLGSPTYMAPEQFADSSKVGPGIDIYSFGAVLFEMLTGTPPFHGNTFLELMNAHRRKPVPSACVKNPDLLRSIDLTLSRSMAKDPKKRYRSAEEFSHALKGAVEGIIPGSSHKYFVMLGVLLAVAAFLFFDPFAIVHRPKPVKPVPADSGKPADGDAAPLDGAVKTPPSVTDGQGTPNGDAPNGTKPETPEPPPDPEELFAQHMAAAKKHMDAEAFKRAEAALDKAKIIKETDETKTLTEKIKELREAKLESEKKNGTSEYANLKKNVNLLKYVKFKGKYPESEHLADLKKRLLETDKTLPPEKYWTPLNADGSPPIGKNNKGYYQMTFGPQHNSHLMIYIPARKIWIDKYEVSMQQVTRFVAREKINNPLSNSGKIYRKGAEYPAVMDYQSVLRYCRAYGFRLPTVQEWEYVAGKSRFTYPWGNEAPNQGDVFRGNYDSLDNIGERDGFDGTAPVASFQAFASPFGAVNMAGNVWEWVDGGVLKGGGVISDMTDLKITASFKGDESRKEGFRCVLTDSEGGSGNNDTM